MRSASPFFIAAIFAGLASLKAADSPVISIEHVAVFDSVSSELLPDRTIVIRGDKFHAVVAPKEPVDVPSDAVRIDGKGKYAIPGLIDAHVHLVHILDFARMTGDEVLPLYLAAGVTSVRSTGEEIVAATLVARIAQSHPESCPRVFTCSPLLDADPPIHKDIGKAVTDPKQVAAILDDLQQWNVPTLKIYARTGRDIGKVIIEEGHRRGFFVTGHLGPYTAQDAVTDGIDGLEHIWSVFNYIIPDDTKREPGYRGRVDFSLPKCEALIAELVKKKVMVDPTLAVFRNMILLPDVPEVKDHPDNALAPQRLRDFWPIYLARTSCPQGGALEDRRREFAKFQELTLKLYKAGVPLLVGTDAPEPQCTPGFSLLQELEMYVEAGIPAAATLRAATLHNAMSVRQEQHLGSISPGKSADLVLLTANPLEDIRNVRKIEIIVHSGKIAKPEELLKLVPKK